MSTSTERTAVDSSISHKVSIPYRQDLPPAGGFAELKYKRNLPNKGPGSVVFLLGVGALSAFGFWRLGKSNQEKVELEREKIWSRIHLVPLLLAEGDRAAYNARQVDLAAERAIMKDVHGWEAGKSVYNNPKYESPRIELR
ncbi:hypothetical protein CYLTODRAFT_488657 [Cylindrobasidium torrendii FP15055 ss-10]|uniref:NADH dehydrogenase [ubiquinone] 1 alpha subcomplex subunit 13 n=1 Tax=Cylindrobasidium torrendii FP15055 ss-10 TaxID=1314674 RepID=A0A0D7BHQ9_9AGAR|nr:hypothetical protein CYLTODRAFT_488657 [Cylindrobasidium torrendii FP15055 ss-10]